METMKGIFTAVLVGFWTLSSVVWAQNVSPTNTQEVQPYIGIGVQMHPTLSFRREAGEITGVIIGKVVCGGPADRAGLKSTDVIISVDGRAVGTIGMLLHDKKANESIMTTHEFEQMAMAIKSGSVGSKVVLKIVRDTTKEEVLEFNISREQITNPQFAESCDSAN